MVELDSLDCEEWVPPGPPLGTGEIQRGVAPITHVKNERASNPFGTALEHWSALPALSYFALSAVAQRESARRIASSGRFRPPPRLTLSDQRREAWLQELQDPRVPLRRLARAVPHGYSGSRLLDLLAELEIPVARAVWFVKCIAANEVRALKRKTGSDSRVDTPSSPALSTGTSMESSSVVPTSAPSTPARTPTPQPAGLGITSPQLPSSRLLPVKSQVGTMPSTPQPLTSQSRAANDSAEQRWLSEWTQVVIEFVDRAITAFDEAVIDSGKLAAWQRRIAYATRLTRALYDAGVINRSSLLSWVLEALKSVPSTELPCIAHFVAVLWVPLSSQRLAPLLLRSIAARYRADPHVSSPELDGLVARLLSANEDVFVAPRTWIVVAPHVRNHPAYHRVALRNESFMPHSVDDPSDWTPPLTAASIIDKFSRPYACRDLETSLHSLRISRSLLVRTLLLRTVRQGTAAAVHLCVGLLKRLGRREGTPVADLTVNFLASAEFFYAADSLGILVAELVHARLLNLDAYFSRLIAAGTLYSAPARDLHVGVLRNLPFHRLAPRARAQAELLLRRADALPPVVDIDRFLTGVQAVFHGKPLDSSYLSELCTLPLDDRHQLGKRIVEMWPSSVPVDLPRLEQDVGTLSSNAHHSVSERGPSSAVLSVISEIVDICGGGSIQLLYDLLTRSLSGPPDIVSCAVRQMRMHLMAFVCAGLADSFASSLVSRLEAEANADGARTDYFDVFAYVTWDDISALRAVIRSPSVVFELSRVIPLRPPSVFPREMTVGTPVESGSAVRAALYRPGAPDMAALVALRGDEHLGPAVVEWIATQGGDRMALLQLVAYRCISIRVAAGGNLQLLRFLLLAPAPEMGFCFEEVDALTSARREYLEELPLKELLTLIASAPAVDCASRLANAFPDVWINRVLHPALESPTTLSLLRSATLADERRFSVLLARCNAFNLRYYQGLAILALRDKSLDDVATEVLDAALENPEHSNALQGLTQRIGDDAKNRIFTYAVAHFLGGEPEGMHTTIDAYATLVLALSGAVAEPVEWTLDAVPSFLSKLVRAAEHAGRETALLTSTAHTEAAVTEDVKVLRNELVLVLRISVIGHLHGVHIPAEAVPYLEALRHLTVFADNFRLRTFIKDALRLLLRIAHPSASRDASILAAGSDPLSGLGLYSKSRDQYAPLNIWPVDLIEDATPTVTKNNGAIDLSLFEAYDDTT